MILNCRRVRFGNFSGKYLLNTQFRADRGLPGIAFFTGGAAAKNGIFHKNKIKRRTQ